MQRQAHFFNAWNATRITNFEMDNVFWKVFIWEVVLKNDKGEEQAGAELCQA